MSKGLEWAFFSPKKAYKWPTGPWKDVPATLIIRKTQIKTTRYHPTLFGMVIIKKKEYQGLKKTGKKGTLYLVSGDMNWQGHCRKHYGGP